MSIVPTSGCNAISEGGICYGYFSDSLNWYGARSMCLAWGGDLATVTSLEENLLMYNTYNVGDECWIGLNDLVNEGTFVWVDGSISTYRLWGVGEPSESGSEDCGCTWVDEYWNDWKCPYTLSCYFCSTNGEYSMSMLCINRTRWNHLMYQFPMLY